MFPLTPKSLLSLCIVELHKVSNVGPLALLGHGLQLKRFSESSLLRCTLVACIQFVAAVAMENLHPSSLKHYNRLPTPLSDLLACFSKRGSRDRKWGISFKFYDLEWQPI